MTFISPSCFLIRNCLSAVQQERRPDQKEKQPVAVAMSTQKVYIRKDFSSTSTAIPTFGTKVSLCHYLFALGHTAVHWEFFYEFVTVDVKLSIACCFL